MTTVPKIGQPPSFSLFVPHMETNMHEKQRKQWFSLVFIYWHFRLPAVMSSSLSRFCRLFVFSAGPFVRSYKAFSTWHLQKKINNLVCFRNGFCFPAQCAFNKRGRKDENNPCRRYAAERLRIQQPETTDGLLHSCECLWEELPGIISKSLYLSEFNSVCTCMKSRIYTKRASTEWADKPKTFLWTACSIYICRVNKWLRWLATVCTSPLSMHVNTANKAYG